MSKSKKLKDLTRAHQKVNNTLLALTHQFNEVAEEIWEANEAGGKSLLVADLKIDLQKIEEGIEALQRRASRISLQAAILKGGN